MPSLLPGCSPWHGGALSRSLTPPPAPTLLVLGACCRRDAFSKRFGIVYVDLKDLSRHPKMSAHWMQKYFFDASK